jgi:hypothetical protein
MLRFVKTKKGLAVLATLVVVGVASFGAYAYWTASGSGTGTGIAGSAADANVVIHLGASGWDGIVPGDGGQPVAFTAWNDSTTTDGAISTIKLGAVTVVGDTSPAGACGTYLATYGALGASDDFSMTDVDETTVGSPFVVPAGTSSASSASPPNQGTLVWKNNPAQDQSVCGGQTLEVAFTSS